jgi:hypothetical protein
LTWSTAIDGAFGDFMSSVIGHAHGRLPCSSARSAPVNTASTPGSSRAALTSIDVILACAIGLRRIDMCTRPGSVRLSVQRVRPVMSRASSLRLRALPTSGSIVAVTVRLPP